MSFCYNVDDMPQELNSRLYQLACGKMGFIICHFAVLEPIDDTEDLLYFSLKAGICQMQQHNSLTGLNNHYPHFLLFT